MGTCLKYSNFKKSSLLILPCNSLVLVINTKLYDHYSLYILNELMDFVQDKVMKCPYHGHELQLALWVCFQSLWGRRERGKQNQNAKIEDIFRLLQPSTGQLLLPIFSFVVGMQIRNLNTFSQREQCRT